MEVVYKTDWTPVYFVGAAALLIWGTVVYWEVRHWWLERRRHAEEQRKKDWWK